MVEPTVPTPETVQAALEQHQAWLSDFEQRQQQVVQRSNASANLQGWLAGYDQALKDIASLAEDADADTDDNEAAELGEPSDAETRPHPDPGGD